MKLKRIYYTALASIASLSCTISVWGAVSVSIDNAGFETDVLANGDHPPIATAPTGWLGGYYDTGNLVDWFNETLPYRGAFNPDIADFGGVAPEGDNVAWAQAYANYYMGLNQVLTDTLLPGMSYDLSVEVGNPEGINAGAATVAYRIEVLAGGTKIIEAEAASPATGTFTTVTPATYVAPAFGDPVIGETLEIRLMTVDNGTGGTGGGLEVHFDDVSLTRSDLLVPVADPGGPYGVLTPTGDLLLDASGSIASDGNDLSTGSAAIEWDLNNDSTFGDVVGLTPAAVSAADLTGTWGMVIGANTIQLRVTDSAGNVTVQAGTVNLADFPSAVAYWPMRDGLPGDTVTGADDVIDDASHPATDGTVSGNSNATWEADPVRGIVYNTSEGNRLLAGTQGINLNVDSGWTWSLWVKASSSNVTDPGADCLMGTRNGSWNKMDRTGASNWINPSYPNWADDTWRHVVYVGDATGAEVYYDGSPVGAKDTTFNGGHLLDKSALRLEIGGTSQFSEDVTGLYSDVAIWKVALTPGQITELYNGRAVVTDTTAPVLAATTPVDDDSNAPLLDLQLIFDEPVEIGTGDICIVNDTDVSTTTIPVGDAQVTVSGAQITISPTTPLLVGKAYHIEMDAGVVDDLSGNPFGGIGDATTWNFTTDNIPPLLVSIDDNVGGGPIYEDQAEVTFTVTFDEPMDGSTVTAVDFDNAGTATIDPIGTITQTGPAVFTVVVSPTSTGTLTLRIPVGGIVSDISGNTLIPPVNDLPITILSGTNPGTGDRYWDGTTTAGITDGVSQGGAATWDTVTTNWDRGVGFANPVAWNNGNNDTANFGGASGLVTLDADISLGGLLIGGAHGYAIGTFDETHTLNFAGGSTITVDQVDATIRAGITGAPTINATGRNDSNDGFFELDPSEDVTMTIGTLNKIKSGPSQRNAALRLGGVSSGNVVDLVTWTNGGQQIFLRKQDTSGSGADGSDWTITQNLNLNSGRVYVEEGTLICSGTANFSSHFVQIQDGGRLVAGGDWKINDNREDFIVQSGGIIAPGGSVGSLSVSWNRNAGEIAFFDLQTGSTYEWEVGAGNTSDVIHLEQTSTAPVELGVGTMTLKVIDAGGTPSAGDQLPVFTYETGGGVTVPLTATLNANVTIDISGTSWTGTPSLVNDGAGTVYLTGLSSGALSPYDTWAGGFGGLGDSTFTLDFDGGGLQTGIEWVVGGDPSDSSDDAGLAPTLDTTTTPGSALFAFRRTDDAAADSNTSIKVEYGSTLTGWTEAQDGVDGVVITVDNDFYGVGIDKVTASLPDSLAVGGELYARLNVVVTP